MAVPASQGAFIGHAWIDGLPGGGGIVPATIAGSSILHATGSGARVITPAAGVADGDLLIVLGANGSASATLTPPAGFTTVKNNVITGSLLTGCFTRTRTAGDTTYSFTMGLTASSSFVCLNIRGWSGSPVVGADGTRAASGAALVTTAPSVTTAAANTLVLLFGTERTTTAETGITSVDNGFTQYLFDPPFGASIETLFIGTKLVASAGAVGASSITYPNAQVANALAFHIAVPGIAA